MNVVLEVSPPTTIIPLLITLSLLCFMAVLMVGGLAQRRIAKGGDKEPTRVEAGAVTAAMVGVFVFLFLAMGLTFFHEKDKMDPLEAAYAEQHGVTDMDAQVTRSSELGVLRCLEHNRQGSVSYKWTDAYGERKSGLLEKDFAYQGRCEYTLTAIE